jgi:hypothetical protein
VTLQNISYNSQQLFLPFYWLLLLFLHLAKQTNLEKLTIFQNLLIFDNNATESGVGVRQLDRLNVNCEWKNDFDSCFITFRNQFTSFYQIQIARMFLAKQKSKSIKFISCGKTIRYFSIGKYVVQQAERRKRNRV